MVRDGWQNRSIGSFPCKHPANIARRNGIKGFTAEALRDNAAMPAVFDKSGLKTKMNPEGEIISYAMDFQ